MESERKDPEKEPQKVTSEPSLKGRTPLVKVEESTVEEGTPDETESAPGRSPLTVVTWGLPAPFVLSCTAFT